MRQTLLYLDHLEYATRHDVLHFALGVAHDDPCPLVNHITLQEACATVRKEEAFEGLLEAARLKRNAIIHDNPDFGGAWIAIPREDFDALRAAIARAEGRETT